MASSVVIKTMPVTREKLARVLGNNQELIRLLESLVADVVVNIPAGTDILQSLTEDNDAGLSLATALANLALAQSNQAREGPPVLVQVISDIPNDTEARLSALTARVAELERRLSETLEGPLA